MKKGISSLLLLGLFSRMMLQNYVLGQACPLEKSMVKSGLLSLHAAIPDLKVDLRYSGTRNFLKSDIYGCLERAYGQPMLVKKLKKALKLLREKKPGHHFVVFDAARPLTCQWALWNAIKAPESRKHIYVANPRKGSIHNYGCALDLSLVDERGIALDMGTEFDFFGEMAQPRCEARLFKAGKLTRNQLENRKLLRNCMQQAGFSGTTSEWWHFNACSLREAKRKFALLP